ncbi:MAG: hypothetical protein LAN71_11010 [Acidobacteriia bacterium]|nr:hypothetical protein [Terriglobia bacterium]
MRFRMMLCVCFAAIGFALPAAAQDAPLKESEKRIQDYIDLINARWTAADALRTEPGFHGTGWALMDEKLYSSYRESLKLSLNAIREAGRVPLSDMKYLDAGMACWKKTEENLKAAWAARIAAENQLRASKCCDTPGYHKGEAMMKAAGELEDKLSRSNCFTTIKAPERKIYHVASMKIDMGEFRHQQLQALRASGAAEDAVKSAQEAKRKADADLAQERDAYSKVLADDMAKNKAAETAARAAALPGGGQAKKSAAYAAHAKRLAFYEAQAEHTWKEVLRARDRNEDYTGLLASFDQKDQLAAKERKILENMPETKAGSQMVAEARKEAERLDEIAFAAAKVRAKAFGRLQLTHAAASRAADTLLQAQREEAAAKRDQDRLAGAPISDVRVSVEGTGVCYHAQAANFSIQEKLDHLDLSIRHLAQQVTDAEDMRYDARQRFLAAGDDAVAADRALAGAILKSAGLQALTEWGFNVSDVLKEFGRGGLAGAIAEGGKQVAEAALIDTWEVSAPNAQKVSEALLNQNLEQKDFDAMEKNAKDNAKKLVVDRPFEIAEAKAAKSKAAKEVQAAWNRADEDFEELRAATGEWKKAKEELETAKMSGLWRAGAKEKAISAGKIVAGAAATYVKNLAKDEAKRRIEQAIADFVEGPAVVDSLVANQALKEQAKSMLVASSIYWAAADSYRKALAERDQLAKASDLHTNMSILVSKDFVEGNGLNIGVDFFLKPPATSTNHDADVELGGKAATNGGYHSSHMGVKELQDDGKGGVALVVHVKR